MKTLVLTAFRAGFEGRKKGTKGTPHSSTNGKVGPTIVQSRFYRGQPTKQLRTKRTSGRTPLRPRAAAQRNTFVPADQPITPVSIGA